MKHCLLRIFTSVIIAAGFSACGIADISAPPQPKLSGGFSCECTVSAFIIPPGDDSGNETEFTFSGNLTRLGTGFWTLDMTSPDTVSGMKISSFDGDMTSSLGDLTFDISEEDVPVKSPVYALFTSLDNMSAAFENGDELVSGENGGWIYQSDGLSAVFDGEGYLTSMAVASPKMTAEFSGFKPAEKTAESSPVTETAPETSSETVYITTLPPAATTAESTTSIITERTVISETTISQAPETTVPSITME